MAEEILGGANKAFRHGNTFVKTITRGGSPHAEVAASKAMSLLGVPHNPVNLRSNNTITAPFLKMTPIARLGEHGDQSYIPHLANSKQHFDTLLGEWVNSISDRHAGNYALTPHQGIISIDHGMAFHPGTYRWNKMLEGEPLEGYNKLEGEPYNWSENPDSSSLMQHAYNQYDERTHGNGTDQKVAERALTHQDELEQLAYDATKDLPESERVLARLAMRTRLNVLEHHLKKNAGRPINRDVLANLHRRAIELAQRTFGGRKGFP